MSAAWLRGLGAGWIVSGVALMPALPESALGGWAIVALTLAVVSYVVDRRDRNRWRRPRHTNVQIVSDGGGTQIRLNGVDVARALAGARLEMDPRGNALTLHIAGGFTLDADVQAEIDKVDAREDSVADSERRYVPEDAS